MDARICRGAVEYQLGEFLGEGLNSQVYRAIRRDPKGHIEQVVAIKILKSQTLVSTWKLELESLARVTSPHCISVLGWDWILDRPALVLEYVRGISLETALNSGIGFSREEVGEILCQIESGLADIHRAGICHGDLSLHNIMIDFQGRVALVDFGLGNIVPGEVRCTPGYAHPRLLEGASPSPATDHYSLERVREDLLSLVPTHSQSGDAEPSHALLREAIGFKIQSHLCRNRTEVRTQKLQSDAGPRPLLRVLASFSFLPFVFGLVGSQPAGPKAAPSAMISVRTQTWGLVRLTGHRAQYAPLDRAVKPGQHHLRVETPNGVWERTLTLRAGDHIFIGEPEMRSPRRSHETGQGSKPQP